MAIMQQPHSEISAKLQESFNSSGCKAEPGNSHFANAALPFAPPFHNPPSHSSAVQCSSSSAEKAQLWWQKWWIYGKCSSKAGQQNLAGLSRLSSALHQNKSRVNHFGCAGFDTLLSIFVNDVGSRGLSSLEFSCSGATMAMFPPLHPLSLMECPC